MKLLRIVQAMSSFIVAETFVSINGESNKSGELSLFIRFVGCNLRCSYCDTAWAIDKNSEGREYSSSELLRLIDESGVDNITITGGEPLLQKNLIELLTLIPDNKNIEIESNGSIPIEELKNMKNPPGLTMDYKLPTSNMESKMHMKNLGLLDNNDCLKFVVGSKEDLDRAYEIIINCNLTSVTNVYLSPVFNEIEPKEIVNFMSNKKLNGVKLQLQLHKFIWDPQMMGV